MPARSLRLGARPEVLRFPNGTILAGLAGEGAVRQRVTPAGLFRSATLPAEIDTDPRFDRALAAAGIEEQETLVVDAVRLQGEAATIEPARPPGEARPQVVLYQDESGGLSWHFAPPPRPGRPGLRAAAPTQRFTIPLRSGAAQRALASGPPRRSLRGPITTIGRKLFKVLVLPAAAALLRDPVAWLGETVEHRVHPYRVWQATPDNYRTGPAEPFTAWDTLRAGPALLLVHGIFSSVAGMLSGLPRDAMAAWCTRYQGRVLAFDHPTASASPDDNAAWLLKAIAQALPGERPTFDIVCHSRGGIVSRALAERGELLAGARVCDIRGVYFAATPNAGSPIGDAGHMVDMIDLFTNFLTDLPDGPVSYSIEVVVGLVTLMGYAAATGLPGIAALGTRTGFIVDALNRAVMRSPAFYAAAAADYEPRPGRDNGWLLDHLGNAAADRMFEVDGRREANDLVVPEQGVFAANGHPSFPIDDPLVFGPGEGVWHTAFFAQPRTVAHIEGFLDRLQAGRGGERVEHAPAAPVPVVPGGIVRGGFRGGGGRRGAAPPPDDFVGGLRGAEAPSRPGIPPPSHGARGAGIDELFGLEPDIPGGGENMFATPLLVPTAAQAEAPVPAEPPRIVRDPSLGFPDHVVPGRTEELIVLLREPRGGPAPPGRIDLPLDEGTDELMLTVEVSAPGFRIEGERHAALVIRRRLGSEPERVVFHLTALDPGEKPVEREIDVAFWRGNDCVGGLSQRTIVVPAGQRAQGEPGPGRASPLRVPARRREQADLVLTVRQPDRGRSLYEIDMRCGIEGEEYESRPFGAFDLDGRELSRYLADALDPHFLKFPGSEVSDADWPVAVADWNHAFMTALADLGKQLWLHLPAAFREEYLRLRALPTPPRSLFVFSDELAFPWEIVRPSGKLEGRYQELPPLGVAHAFGRWRPATAARPQPQTKAVGRMVLVIPDAQAAGLPAALSEQDKIRRLVDVAAPWQPATRAGLDRLLASTDVGVVHFSGHGQIGPNADLSSLDLEGGEAITAMAFAANALGSEAQPVLFLNACSVGRSGRVLARAGGFAGNCIEAGWSGIVAPYWPVYDSAAADFGVAFYAKLKAGCTVGQALQELRAESPDDPTAQSYAWFGDPFARLAF
jgi:hypothetical protein